MATCASVDDWFIGGSVPKVWHITSESEEKTVAPVAVLGKTFRSVGKLLEYGKHFIL